jgi:hypothetical protein
MIKGQKRQPSIVVSHPQLLAEWHPDLNVAYSPEQLTANSNYRAWWQCLKWSDHVWRRSVAMRAQNSSPCPFCFLEDGSLAKLYPAVARLWHPTLNGSFRPEDVVPGSDKKAWWLCDVSDEHVYEATIWAKAIVGSGCHFCTGQKLDSKRSLKLHDPSVAKEWHPTKNGKLLAEDVSYGSALYAWWRCTEDPTHEWQDPVYKRTSSKKPGCPFCNGFYLTDQNRLSVCCPEIASQWHQTKNRKFWTNFGGTFRLKQNLRVPPVEREQKKRRLTASDVSITSHEYVWWQCHVNVRHVWQAVVADRVRYKTGCPFCTNQKIADDNNLAAKYPKLVKLWHTTKNLPLLPSQVVPGSGKKVWWRCPAAYDHVWEAPVNKVVDSRNHGHRACPFCAGRRVCATNNLAARYPEIAKLWHPNKNRIQPSAVLPNSNRIVWWLCLNGHEFKSAPFRLLRSQQQLTNKGCPYCSGRLASAEDNLAVRFPVIAKLWWHPSKNLPLRANQVRHGSGKKLWFGCTRSKQHAWQATVCKVVAAYKAQRLKCPQCN